MVRNSMSDMWIVVLVFMTLTCSSLGQSCNVGQSRGSCKDVRSCGGISLSGYCPGASNIQCCLLEPTGSTIMHLPKSPSSSGNQGSCTTPQDFFRGICISTSACTGATFNGLCPGSSKCCVRETSSVPDLLRDPTLSRETAHLDLLSYSQFRNLYTGISSTRAEALFPYYNYGLAEVLLDSRSSSESCYRSAAFAAQVGHESAGLLYFEEIASGAAYEGREDLGNIYPGDGVRYKGRGPIQLTGRANYASAGSRLGESLEADPEKVCFPNMGFLTTVDYWMSRNLNRYAGSPSQNDFISLTRLINGGTNGLDDRLNRWYAARRLLGCDNNERPEQEDDETDVNIQITTEDEATKIVIGMMFIVAVVAFGAFLVRNKNKKNNGGGNENAKENDKVIANPMFA